MQVEARPLVLVEAKAEDGAIYSTLLQNAETVRLVGPAADAADTADGGQQASCCKNVIETL